MTETEIETQEKDRLTLGDFDRFDKAWLLLWVGLTYAWPLWSMRADLEPSIGAWLGVMLGLTLFWGLPLAWLGSKLRAPLRRLFGLTAATASQRYQSG